MFERNWTLKVFIASPGDLANERQIARRTVDEINKILEGSSSWRVDLLGWEDTLPTIARPQEAINRDVDRCDVFIGLLWKRWGTSTGDEYSSGFHEEFSRAIARRARTASVPEVWMFFKSLSRTEREDPGEQLKQVLKFRDDLVADKKVFFKEFEDTEEWTRLIKDILIKYIWRLDKDIPVPSAVPHLGGSVFHEPGGVLEQPNIKRQDAALISEISGYLSSSGSLERLPDRLLVKLLMFTSRAANRKVRDRTLSAYEIVYAFAVREQISFDQVELLHLIESYSALRGRNAPVWYWLKDVGELTFLRELQFIARFHEYENIRAGAISLIGRMDDLGASPLLDWGKFFLEILNDKSEVVIKETIPAIAMHLDFDDLGAALKRLRNAVGVQPSDIDYVEIRVRLRSDVSDGFEAFLEKNAKLDTAILRSLAESACRVSIETLQRALGHRDGKVRLIALNELLRRPGCSESVVRSVLTDSDPDIVLRGFEHFFQVGSSFSEKDIIAAFKGKLRTPGILGLLIGAERSDHLKVAVGYFYQSLSDAELRQKLEGDFGYLAYKTLVERNVINIDTVKKDIAENFIRVKGAKSFGSSSSGLFGLIDPDHLAQKEISAYLISALEGLATKQCDDLILRIEQIPHNSEADVLAMMITLIDRNLISDEGRSDFLAEMVEKHSLTRASNGRMVGDDAINVLVRFDPTRANALLQSPQIYDGTKAKLLYYLDEANALIASDDLLLGFLRSSSAELRGETMKYLRSKFSPKDQAGLLRRYMTEGLYYFDVVAEFDESLFRPAYIHLSRLSQSFRN